MPLIITPDPERDAAFVKHFTRTGDAVAACAQARVFCVGYDMRDVAAYQLARPEVQRLISVVEERKATEPPMEFTKDSVISDFQNVYDRALDAGEFQAAIAAKKTQAQVLGLLDQNINLNVKTDVNSMSDEQILKMLKARESARNTPKMIDITPVATPPTTKAPGIQMQRLGLSAAAAYGKG